MLQTKDLIQENVVLKHLHMLNLDYKTPLLKAYNYLRAVFLFALIYQYLGYLFISICLINDNDDAVLFLRNGWLMEGILTYFQPGPLSEILTILNLRNAASRIWNCAEQEFRICWRKLCGSHIHYTTAPRR